MKSLSPAVKPFLLVPLLAALVIAVAGAALPSLLHLTPYAQEVLDRQVDREHSALCEKFGFSAGGGAHSACRSDLANLRRRHELLVLR